MLNCLYWFLVIAGGAYFTVSFVVGEIVDLGEGFLEGVGEGIGDAIEGLFGAADTAHLDAAGTDIDVDSGLSQFNLRTIAMGAAGFGAGGLMGTGVGLSEPLSLLMAFGTGLLVGFISWQILRIFYKEQATTSIQPTDYTGLIGRVNIPITNGKLGMVMVTVKMRKKNMPAKSEDGKPIPSQTQVEIVSVEGGVLIVRKLS